MPGISNTRIILLMSAIAEKSYDYGVLAIVMPRAANTTNSLQTIFASLPEP